MSANFHLLTLNPGLFQPCSSRFCWCRPWGVVVDDLEDDWPPNLLQSATHPIIEPKPFFAVQSAATDVPCDGAESSPVAGNEAFVVIEGADPSGSDPQLVRGMRTKHPLVLFREYVTHTLLSPSLSSPSSSASRAVLIGVGPRNFTEAISDPGWSEAMAKKIAPLKANDGTIKRLKARLVILGNHQVVGIDYHETFAPVAKMVTVRIFLAIDASRNWELHQMNEHNAFLHGNLDEEVYMKVPPGFYVGRTGMVCKLRKFLYGLRQASRCWKGQLELYFLVYVDDLIVDGNSSSAVSSFKEYLGRCFHMKYLGILKYFLGIEVARGSEGLFLSQDKYTFDMISEAGLLGSKPAAFPMEQNHTLALAKGAEVQDLKMYHHLAEYRSMADVTSELKWLKELLLDFGIPHVRPMTLFCNSQSVLHIVQNPVFHERTKHIEVDCHYIHDVIRDGLLTTVHLSTAVQLADIFTKALGKEKKLYLLRKLGISFLPAPT
ncbi:transmembrane signal receptor [Lithospermum erythrorhizon]|uniref:Transmembrane signal receptor n=1 Tax=Lithospermum erythrorhizon TaxID=34254 RepID=A0AAV3P381_LITER